jgi:acetyltransferase-like isoleucine patch superfamily enzyme
MAKRQMSLWSRIIQKGLWESFFVVVRTGIGYVTSLVIGIGLRMRGYRVASGTHIHPTAEFFQTRKYAIHIATGTDIRRYTRLNAGFAGNIRIGRNVLLDQGTVLMAQHAITIGNDVLIAAYCFIVDFNHAFTDKNKRIIKQGYVAAPIVIEDDVWIGAHVMILPGVHIGKGAVVGAGSVVTKNVKAYQVVAGNPAKVIKKRT